MTRTNATGSHSHDLTAIDSAIAALEARVSALEAASAPTEPPPGGYDATFTASGNDDALRLRDFVAANRGKRLLIEGPVMTSGGSAAQWTGSGATIIDFAPGASLRAVKAGNAALVLFDCWDLTFNDLRIVGTGWDGTYYANRQWEAGVLVEGGGRLTFNRPDIRDTKGDGFDIDVWTQAQPAPVGVVITDPTLYQNARNGITGNAGQLTVTGGTIDRSGLHNIDMEPNHDAAAVTIDCTFTGMRLTNHGVLYVADNPGDPDIAGFAIAGLGYSGATKKAIRIRDCSSDTFTLAVDRAAVFEFTGNRSDSPVTACGPGPAAHTVFAYGMGAATISGNTGICVNTTWDLAGPR